MKGTKRFASQSGPAPDSNDNVFKSKRIIAGSPFDPNRAEPSKEGERVHLDVQRAESSRQHVRALNKQFLSWVQSQLQDHPDELWEDGVQDYLTHASHIKEKFSDVVAWIKANPAKPGSAHEAEKIVTEAKSNEGNFELNNNNVFGLAGSTFMPGSDKKVGSEAKNHEIKFQPNNSGFGLAGSTFSQGTEKKVEPEKKNPEAKFQPNNNSVFGLASSTFSQGTEKKAEPEKKNPEAKFQLNNNSIFGLSGSTFSQGTENKAEPEKKNPESKFQLNNISVFGLGGSTFSQGTEKKLEPEKKNPEAKFQLNNNSVFGQVGSSPSFASPWNSGLLKNSQSPVLFGSPSSVPVNRDASDDADAEDEVEKPSSPSVKKTEEKGIIVVHEVKCKLYIKSTDPADKDTWKDKGMGQLSIKCKEGISKATKESKPTVIVRNDVGKVLLNALLYPGIKTNLLKNAIAAIFHTSSNADGGGEVVARTYLLRTKTEDERNKLASAIQEYAPTA